MKDLIGAVRGDPEGVGSPDGDAGSRPDVDSALDKGPGSGPVALDCEHIQETGGRVVECAKVILDGLESRDAEVASAGPDSYER